MPIIVDSPRHIKGISNNDAHFTNGKQYVYVVRFNIESSDRLLELGRVGPALFRVPRELQAVLGPELGFLGWPEGGTEVIGGVQKWLIPCNWKFPAENFSGDSYRNISHRSVDLVGIGPSGTGRRDLQERINSRRLHICFPERGHQTGAFVLPEDAPTPTAYQNSPVVSEYFKYCEEERRRRKGEWGRLTGSPGEIFPNTALHPRQPRTMAVWHPRGPHETEVWRWYLVDRDAQEEVENLLREYYIRYSGPGGLTEQDDMENWNYAHTASRGTIARRYPYNYEQGLGYESRNFVCDGLKIPGLVTNLTEVRSSEDNLQNLYKRWAEFKDAESWDELATWRNGPGENGHGGRKG